MKNLIGILAAVALPKYKDAIAKSEISGYFPFVKALAQAQEDYYMTNGKYSISLENLAVSVPGSCIYDASSKNNVYCSDSIVIDNQRSYNSSLGKYEPTGRIAVRYCPGIARQGEVARLSWRECGSRSPLRCGRPEGRGAAHLL